MPYAQISAGVKSPSSATVPSAKITLTSKAMFSSLRNFGNGVDLEVINARPYLTRDTPINGRIFSPSYAIRYLHAQKFLINAAYLNPSQSFDGDKLLDVETQTNNYPITNLAANSTKVKIEIPASPEIGLLSNDSEFGWKEKSIWNNVNYNTLSAPTIDSVELVEIPLFNTVAYSNSSEYDKTIQPHYLKITLNTPAQGPAGTATRFFHLRINGVHMGSFGSESYVLGSGSSYALRTTYFPYGTLKIEVAMFDLITDTTFSSMQYAKSNLSPVFTYEATPSFSNRIYSAYGSYGVPDVEDYYGSFSDMVSENQTVTTIPEEKDIKIIELSEQAYKHSLLYPTTKWNGTTQENGTYTPIFIDANIAVGKFKATIIADRRKVYGLDPYFFEGALINGIRDIKIELLDPLKNPRQINKFTTSYDYTYPGVIGDIYNMMTFKYFPSNYEYSSKYLNESQPQMLRGSAISTAIENIIKKRYILNKQSTEYRIASLFKNDPGLMFNFDKRCNFFEKELTDIYAADDCTSSPETKNFVFYGIIQAQFKMLSSVGKTYETANPTRTAKFDYKLIDMNTNKAISSGKEYTVLVFKPSMFSAQLLDPIEGSP